MNKVLIVVDMQNDFISGPLGTAEAKEIIPKIRQKVKNFDGFVIFTMDSHGTDYLLTNEGKNLPVEHCIKGTIGIEIVPELKSFAENIIEKHTFGSDLLPGYIRENAGIPSEIELVGVCTDVCVISNAMILKAFFPEAEIKVDAACCAGITVKNHKNALDSLKAVQIKVYNEEEV